ncbi:hypothetical protein J2Y83_003685 [Pseudomonas marginalis]|jgi:hypothetical protein|nr:hypothetical protein [Pseudomonas marginalis]MCP1507712.1 hypothetical protein [Pseudomonas marginalis]MCP1525216.1 hypothetical protein [Pseudomonas marginalis]MDQ0500189.1 hypothetical protein [Pseudomonas marginalis]
MTAAGLYTVTSHGLVVLASGSTVVLAMFAYNILQIAVGVLGE